MGMGLQFIKFYFITGGQEIKFLIGTFLATTFFSLHVVYVSLLPSLLAIFNFYFKITKQA